jgi:ArsR family transcriptional regulator, arsenate/arsenite/antimonite-responsive transcriptional repressor
MDESRALSAFDALSQPTRLAALRAMIRAGAAGLSAGEVAVATGAVQNTMSAHLSVLLAAGLVRNARQGRSIRYFADMDALGRLIGFLTEDCCGGRPDLCRPVIRELTCIC